LFSVVLAAAVAFVVTFGLGSAFIVFLQSRKFGQFVREEGPQTHLIKAGTPTMGGVVMLSGLVAALLVVARANAATFATLLLVAVVAGIGLYDDWQKISKKRPEGLSARYKFGLLTLAVVLADVLSVYYVGVTQTVLVPYFDLSLVLGPGIVGLALFSGDGRPRRARRRGWCVGASGLHGHRVPGAPVRRRDHLRRDGGRHHRVPLVQLPPGGYLYG
jgi:phospho-N-acetylmuramoyl-pentapeptide-transferase